MNIGVKCIQCLMILMIVACQTEIHKSETVVRHGVVYQKGHKKPFTGFVVGRGREDYRAQMCRYKKQYKDGLLHGTSTYWYSNGNLESEEPYKNGQINGTVNRYHNNGKMKARIPMKNGLRGGGSGEMFWDRKGKLKRG